MPPTPIGVGTMGAMLAPCWHFLRSWALSGLSCASLGCLLAFLASFFAFKSAPGSISEGLGPFREGFGGSMAVFFEVFACKRGSTAQMLQPLQNTGRSDKNQGFLHTARLARKPQNHAKSVQEPFEQSFPQRLCNKLVLGCPGLDLGGLWGPPRRLLAASWAPLAASWPLLGASWPPLGRSWAASSWSWAPLGCILALGEAPDWILKASGSLRGALLRLQGPIFSTF